MSSDARPDRLPDGPYTIRVDGINTEDNFVTVVPKGSERGYNLFVRKNSEESVFHLKWSGEDSLMMIFPIIDRSVACTAIKPDELAVVPPGEVVPEPFSFWGFMPVDDEKKRFIISTPGLEPGVLNNWSWDGDFDKPVELSMRDKTVFIVTRLLEE